MGVSFCTASLLRCDSGRLLKALWELHFCSGLRGPKKQLLFLSFLDLLELERAVSEQPALRYTSVSLSKGLELAAGIPTHVKTSKDLTLHG